MRELSIFEAARRSPRRDCLVIDSRVWSFEAVAARVEAAVAALLDRGIAPGDRVGLVADLDLDSLIWLYALFELGCPVVLFHPALTDGEREAWGRAANTSRVVRGSSLGDRTGVPHTVPLVPADRCLAIVATSGTGGRARGALLSRRAFVASCLGHSRNLGWTEEDRWLLTMPVAHVGGLSIVTRCLIARRCVVIAPGFAPERVLDAIWTDRVTLLSVVPTMLRRLLDCTRPRWQKSAHLRAVLVGGAAFPDRLREEAHDRGIPVLATYGSTETCSQIATQRMEQSGKPGSGEPLDGVSIRLRGGEVQVRGPMLMDGYVGGGSEASPWTEDGWLRTRDAGTFQSDGQLRILGRLDDVIVSGGENVIPAEVEAAILEVPGVVGACVFSLPHETWGQEVAAALVVDPCEFDRSSFVASLREHLAAFKRPKRIAVVEALPVNRAGKVDRPRVVERCLDRLEPI